MPFPSVPSLSSPTTLLPGRNCSALMSNFVEERVQPIIRRTLFSFPYSNFVVLICSLLYGSSKWKFRSKDEYLFLENGYIIIKHFYI
jgi:hypothetical protein